MKILTKMNNENRHRNIVIEVLSNEFTNTKMLTESNNKNLNRGKLQ